MKTILFSIIATFFLSCSTKTSSENDSLSTAATDSILNSGSYIGTVNNFYFSKNNEAYIELYFKDDDAYANYEQIVALGDSVIYHDDKNTRTRIPNKAYQEYFDLSGLETISIFDSKSNFICNAKFARVEYLDQNISSYFIAVYDTDRPLKSDSYYYISNFKEKLKTSDYTITKDTVLSNEILDELNVTKPYYDIESNGFHFKYKNTDEVLSIVNSDNNSFVVFESHGARRVLYKSTGSENAYEVIVVPILKNKMPYILLKCVKPEGDIMWDHLLYFDGKNYKALDRQRIQ
jgi:hypothetical protein